MKDRESILQKAMTLYPSKEKYYYDGICQDVRSNEFMILYPEKCNPDLYQNAFTPLVNAAETAKPVNLISDYFKIRSGGRRYKLWYDDDVTIQRQYDTVFGLSDKYYNLFYFKDCQVFFNAFYKAFYFMADNQIYAIVMAVRCIYDKHDC